MTPLIDIMRYRSKQDAVLIFFVVASSAQIGGLIYLLVSCIGLLASHLWSKALTKTHIPEEARAIEIPVRTYFLRLDRSEIGRFYIMIAKHKHKYFAWSFFVINFIFCPNHKTKDQWGVRQMQLYHEVAHCARGEFSLFLLSIFSIIQLILVPNFLAVVKISEPKYFYHHITLNMLGFYMIWVGNEIMVRREYIADHLAYQHAGDRYLTYMKSRVEAFPISTEAGKTGHLGALLATYFKWHPSWKQRVQFVEGDEGLPGTGYWRICGAAFAVSAGSFSVAQFMISPKNPIFKKAFGSYWNDDVSLVGVFLMFTIVLCVGWLICDGSRLFGFRKWLGLTFFYCVGALTAQFSWHLSEIIFVRDQIPSTLEITSFPATFICWFVFHAVLYANAPMRRSRWSYSIYSVCTFFFIFVGLGSIERDFFKLGLIEPPYGGALKINLVSGLAMTGYCAGIACGLDLVRISLLAVKNRIWSRFHPQLR